MCHNKLQRDRMHRAEKLLVRSKEWRMCVCVHAHTCTHEGKVEVMFLTINAVEQALAHQIKDIFPVLIALNNCDRTSD